MTIKLLNRSAIVIRAKQPMADWVARVAPDEETDLATLRMEGTVYLIDEVEEESGFVQALGRSWRAIFENELAAWDEFGDDWPDKRDQMMFEQWFEADPQVLAFDLSAQSLLRAELEG